MKIVSPPPGYIVQHGVFDQNGKFWYLASRPLDEDDDEDDEVRHLWIVADEYSHVVITGLYQPQYPHENVPVFMTNKDGEIFIDYNHHFLPLSTYPKFIPIPYTSCLDVSVPAEADIGYLQRYLQLDPDEKNRFLNDLYDDDDEDDEAVSAVIPDPERIQRETNQTIIRDFRQNLRRWYAENAHRLKLQPVRARNKIIARRFVLCINPTDIDIQTICGVDYGQRSSFPPIRIQKHVQFHILIRGRAPQTFTLNELPVEFVDPSSLPKNDSNDDEDDEILSPRFTKECLAQRSVMRISHIALSSDEQLLAAMTKNCIYLVDMID